MDNAVNDFLKKGSTFPFVPDFFHYFLLNIDILSGFY